MLSKQDTQVDRVINFEIDDSLLVERISGRRIHPASGRSYHTSFNPPKVDGKDDLTGEPLIQRKDDNPETLVTRLSAFHKQTQPVIDYYKKKGKLVEVNAERSMNDVSNQIRLALGKSD